jgi:hypothetical protein
MKLDVTTMEELARLAQKHEEQLLLIKQDNVLDLIKRHCLACRGYIGNSLLPPKVELTRKHPIEAPFNSGRIAIACPMCGYVMMFDVDLTAAETSLPASKEPGY